MQEVLTVMLDLETMATKPNAAIVSIGAVVMDFNTGELGQEFYRTINLESCLQAGLQVDGDTVMWWLRQPNEARQGLLEGPGPSCVSSALLDFSAFLGWPASHVHIWGNGAAFDNVVLRSAYEATQITPPWTYKGDRCYRTMCKEYPEVPYPDLAGLNLIPHNALDDAKAQAHHLLVIKGHIRKGQFNG